MKVINIDKKRNKGGKHMVTGYVITADNNGEIVFISTTETEYEPVSDVE